LVIAISAYSVRGRCLKAQIRAGNTAGWESSQAVQLQSRLLWFGSIKPGERFQMFYIINNLRHAGEQATVSANPFFAFSAITADSLKVFAQQVQSLS
jgi:hypothetical protein